MLPCSLLIKSALKMMSRLFLVALLALLGVVSGFAPVNTPSVVGEFFICAGSEAHSGRRKKVQRKRAHGDGPSVEDMIGEKGMETLEGGVSGS
jgi:hypothetical protein